MISERYRQQVALLVEVMEFVAEEECFALKGGTAINLFHRNLPRLSVDIDLAYLPLHDRKRSLAEIHDALGRISVQMKTAALGIDVDEVPDQQGNTVKLLLRRRGTQVKIETSPVLRGSVWPPTPGEVSETVSLQFAYTSINVVSFLDLYAGKIAAALDRQHPRDLFDVKLLMENEGIDRSLLQTFLVYLISHSRPMNEVLNPNFQDISDIYEQEFLGMTEIPVTLGDLEEARVNLVSAIQTQLTDKDKKFLISVKSAEPNWALLGLEGVEKLPAVQWKLRNLRLLKERNEEKHSQLLSKLDRLLGSFDHHS